MCQDSALPLLLNVLLQPTAQAKAMETTMESTMVNEDCWSSALPPPALFLLA